jgi:SUMO ligase MMS21 Smc5/6 complex component
VENVCDEKGEGQKKVIAQGEIKERCLLTCAKLFSPFLPGCSEEQREMCVVKHGHERE